MVTSRFASISRALCDNFGQNPSDFVHFEVADLERGPHLARHDVGRARHGLDPADRGHLPPVHGGRDLVDGADKVGGSDEGVPALGHGRRARVVLGAEHRDVPAADADDSLDDADPGAGGFEDRALLDVQLEEPRHGTGFALRLVEPRGVAAETVDAVPYGEAGGRDDVEFERLDPARPARGFPVLPPSSFWKTMTSRGCPSANPVVVQRERDLERRRAAHHAVVAAALRHGVQVGPDDDREGGRGRRRHAGR